MDPIKNSQEKVATPFFEVDVSRSEVFVKIKKKNFFWGGWVGGRGLWGGGGVQGRCNREVKFL